MVIPCLSSFLLTVLRTPAVELPVNKKRTRTLSHRESGSSTNCLVDGMGLEQGGSAVSGLQISLYRRCSFLDRCGILGLVQQIGIYKGEY